MSLEELGWDERWQRQLDALGSSAEPARVSVEHRVDYEVLRASGMVRAHVSGRLRAGAPAREARPAVGDWIVLVSDEIDAVLPRRSVFTRKAARERAQVQVIAANVDVVFIVTSANKDFNPRRIERYLTAVHESGAAPVLVLNKTDLCPDPNALLAELGAAAEGLPIACVSALEQRGKEELTRHLGHHKTAALVGMSGVGKSSVANWLLERDALATHAIRRGDDRGQHTTSHRALFPLPGGGVLIDMPGMRELGLWMDAADLSGAFPDIEELVPHCRFGNCEHSAEPGCAVSAAIEAGTLSTARLAHYRQLRTELAEGPKPERRGRGPRRHGRS